jgi:hypothetical protein
MGWVCRMRGATAFRSDCAFPPLCVVSTLCSAVLRERCRVHLPTLPYPTLPNPNLPYAPHPTLRRQVAFSLAPRTHHVLTPRLRFPLVDHSSGVASAGESSLFDPLRQRHDRLCDGAQGRDGTAGARQGCVGAGTWLRLGPSLR